MIKDKSLKLTGNGGLSISAAGKINIKARNIRINSKDDIVYVSEQYKLLIKGVFRKLSIIIYDNVNLYKIFYIIKGMTYFKRKIICEKMTIYTKFKEAVYERE